MMELTAEDIDDLVKRGGIEPFPHVLRETGEKAATLDANEDLVLRGLGTMIKERKINVEDDAEWWSVTHGHAPDGVKRKALQEFPNPCDGSEGKLTDWLPLHPHRLFSRKNLVELHSVETEYTQLYKNHPNSYELDFSHWGDDDNVLPQGGAMLLLSIRFNVTLRESTELQGFPFDRQLLQVEMTLRPYWNLLPMNDRKVEQWAFLTGLHSAGSSVTIGASCLDGWSLGLTTGEAKKQKVGLLAPVRAMVEQLDNKKPSHDVTSRLWCQYCDSAESGRTCIECGAVGHAADDCRDIVDEMVWAADKENVYSLGLQWCEWRDARRFKVLIPIERDPAHILVHVTLPMFLIVATAFTSTFLGEDQLGDQLGIILTMFLTAVAFQFVVSSSIPEKPYLTMVDKYIIFSFMLLAVQAGAAVSGTGFGNSEDPVVPYLYHHAATVHTIAIWVWVLPHFVVLVFFRVVSNLMRVEWADVIRVNIQSKQQTGSCGATAENRFAAFS